jgi:hypothetical protein
MKKQDLQALTSRAIERAVAAREVAGVELTDEQAAGVAGGAGGFSYIKDPSWYGVWDFYKTAKLPSEVVVTQPIERFDASIVAGKVGF